MLPPSGRRVSVYYPWRNGWDFRGDDGKKIEEKSERGNSDCQCGGNEEDGDDGDNENGRSRLRGA